MSFSSAERYSQPGSTHRTGGWSARAGRGAVSGTRAKAEVWSEREEFEKNAATLAAASGKLAAAARSNDKEAFKAQFQVWRKACTGCHSGRKNKGGKFRFPKE